VARQVKIIAASKLIAARDTISGVDGVLEADPDTALAGGLNDFGVSLCGELGFFSHVCALS
jgi:hypothetical protein